jgi:flavodoxin I
LNNENLHNIAESSAKDLESYDLIILGIPTWGVGELHEDWEAFLPELNQVNFQTRKVALFGLGDQEGNPESFCDAMGLIHQELVKKDANIIGYWSAGEYNFKESEAMIDDSMAGLALDEDNESEKTEQRIEQWVEKLKSEWK